MINWYKYGSTTFTLDILGLLLKYGIRDASISNGDSEKHGENCDEGQDTLWDFVVPYFSTNPSADWTWEQTRSTNHQCLVVTAFVTWQEPSKYPKEFVVEQNVFYV